MQTPLLFRHTETSAPARAPEKRGAVYTKPWVTELILDMAGYDASSDLAKKFAVEPAAGEGAFLAPMAVRLIRSALSKGREPLECQGSLLAYELDQESADVARTRVSRALIEEGIPEADTLAAGWVRVGDYLAEAAGLPRADFVVGNPPYIRLEDVPADLAGYYRTAYRTMKGRADLYVAFFEAALNQLADGGVCAFICADRWMLNHYGGELRRLVTSKFAVEAVVEMHEADVFASEVSAYPAVTIIRRGSQRAAVVASVGRDAVEDGGALAKCLRLTADGEAGRLPEGASAARVNSWFVGDEPWPCTSPERLALLKKLEERFLPLESKDTGTRVGIGVATGADNIFITKDETLVEQSRLLPLAMASDISSGRLKWAGNYLVNPWDEDGLVDLRQYPQLKAYLERHREALARRHVAQKNGRSWARTIDRVNSALTGRPKLYVADIKDRLNPVLDRGETYPHHNLYFVRSHGWNLEVLGGLLLSDVAQFFVECYGVRMRGGYLRFQAQYLRRIRVPKPGEVTAEQAEHLRRAFRTRDAAEATAATLEVYGIESIPPEVRGGY
ncbi:MAG: Eco57I restriction-modification methylase domain-containing protein [Pyrinomonadaceae bacterium]